MTYRNGAQAALQALESKKDVYIMAFESSCDETAAAIVKNGREVVSESVFTQIAIHREYGGVVPEIASRNHVSKLPYVADETLKKAGMSFEDIDAFAVTAGPGLVGALLTAVSYAKGLAFAAGKPLIAVNHMKGHVSANFISHKDLEPPFICLLVSGGHTSVLRIDDYDRMTEMGTTRDDAAGEAFDKIARVLGLPYPGGPQISKLAENGDPDVFEFPKTFRGEDHLDFSFSGIKTAAINLIRKLERQDPQFNRADLAASFEKAVVSSLLKNAFEAVKRTGIKKLVLAGGVTANSRLRQEASKLAERYGVTIYMPDLAYCTDNAAMIGSAAYYCMHDGAAPLSLNAYPALSCTEPVSDRF